MTLTAGLAEVDVLVVDVADLANGCHAAYWDVAKFTGRQTDECVSAFFCHELCHVASAAYKLRAFARVKLNVVDEGTNRNVCQRQCVTGLDVCFCAGFD